MFLEVLKMEREETNKRIIELLENLGIIPPAKIPEKQAAQPPDDLKDR